MARIALPFFEHNDPGYVDAIVDPNRRNRDGPKGYLPSAILSALLLMYLLSMESVPQSGSSRSTRGRGSTA